MKTLFKTETLSPKGFVMWAIFFAAAFVVIHALGWREHTSFISGTVVLADSPVASSALKGSIYLLTYFAFLLLTPILLIAAAMWKCLLKCSLSVQK